MDYFQKIAKQAGYIKQAGWKNFKWVNQAGLIISKKQLGEQDLLSKQGGNFSLNTKFSKQGWSLNIAWGVSNVHKQCCLKIGDFLITLGPLLIAVYI